MAKIILVDDDVDLAEMLSGVLRDEGYEVLTVDNESEAVLLLLEEKPDLAILDVMFPENPAGGFDLAREIRKHEELKGLPIIMLTAVNQEFPMDFSANDVDNDWMPVQDFLEKPPVIPILLEKIKGLIEA